jgi:VWFA-related protein
MTRALPYFLPLVCALALAAQAHGQSPLYRIEREQVERDGKAEDRIYVNRKPDAQGKSTLYVTVQFKITNPDGSLAEDVKPDEIIVKENGQRVASVEVQAPNALNALTAVLAMDVSGSMAEQNKMTEAKQAARLFLDRLNPRSSSGLLLFDHRMVGREMPGADRDRLRELVDAATPGGGTAYLDATVEAINMLKGARGRKAVLLMTDGVDLNSKRSLAQVMDFARERETPVYTIGVGEPGKNTPVTSILVLDRSGSMMEPAGEQDNVSKIVALRRAASRFVDIMRPGARTTLLPFNEQPDTPGPFTADKRSLKQKINTIRPGGETAIFDAAYEALMTLMASDLDGKRAVILLTDGKDNRSQKRERDVVKLAREAEIPLHVLGLGTADNLDEPMMRRMAAQTGGTYHRADSERALAEVFEQLSIQLHDEGVDEASLKKLAETTGGKYFPAADISQLKFIYQGLAEELQTTYRVSFPSLRQDDDGTSRDIALSIWRQGTQVSDIFRGGYNVRGVVVPEMDHRIYLGLLAVLMVLLALPGFLQRMWRRTGTATSG